MTDATNKQRQATFRKKKREDGLQEVRGIFAPPELHEAIKEAAKQIIDAGTPSVGQSKRKESL